MSVAAGLPVLSTFPHFGLGIWPTPLHAMPRLSAALGGPTLWVKRDDMSGPADGGNKIRKLEYLVGDALSSGCDTLVSIGAIQSNHTRQVAVAAAMAGLDCVLVQERWVASQAGADKVGNILLSKLAGASTVIVDGSIASAVDADGASPALRRVCDDLTAKGRRPYLIPAGASDHPLGGLGYAGCAAEIVQQAEQLGVRFAAIVIASCTGSSHGGLVAGLHALGVDVPVIGIDVLADLPLVTDTVRRLAAQTAERLGAAAFPASLVDIRTGYQGPAYGVPDQSTFDAMRLGLRTEGLVLDPVYEGKVMAGVCGLVGSGEFGADDHVLFVHLGGLPAIHAYGDWIVSSTNSAGV
jgi:1-aminocyclopropane-1-carboxylate deaminase